MTESEGELSAMLQECSPQREVPIQLRTTQRRREWLASQLLLVEAGVPFPTYLPNGKPVLEQGGISLSHGMHMVAVVVGPGALGIDIQACVVKVLAVRGKFCSAEELAWAEQGVDVLRKFTILWSAKEAVFKYWGERVDFAGEIAIAPFHSDDAFIWAKYDGRHGKVSFRLEHLTWGEHEVLICGGSLLL